GVGGVESARQELSLRCWAGGVRPGRNRGIPAKGRRPRGRGLPDIGEGGAPQRWWHVGEEGTQRRRSGDRVDEDKGVTGCLYEVQASPRLRQRAESSGECLGRSDSVHRGWEVRACIEQADAVAGGGPRVHVTPGA